MRYLFVTTLFCIAFSFVSQATAQEPGFGLLYYENEMIRTVVPPASTPKKGVDDLFVITNGVDGQIPITAVAPGDRDYHGGRWKVYRVSFVDEPVLLTSADDVAMALFLNLVEVERAPEADFKCPVQFLPGN